MPAVLTLGETMALMDPLQDGPFDERSCFRLRVAGAESNFAIALTRLGVPVMWISQVGNDAFGELVVRTISSEGVDVTHVKVHPSAPTGIYFKVREAGIAEVLYYRSGSAASRMTPSDLPDAALEGVRLLHVTGITMALSPTARALVLRAAAKAKEAGAIVTFDPNYRPALWNGPNEACAACREVLSLADWFLCGLEEGKILFGAADAEGLVGELRSAGVGGAAIRIGERGAILDAGDGPVEIAPTLLHTVLDEIGAGDGFAAGFAYALLHGWDPRIGVAIGNWVAGCALRGTGDWETYPTESELKEFLQSSGLGVSP